MQLLFSIVFKLTKIHNLNKYLRNNIYFRASGINTKGAIQ